MIRFWSTVIVLAIIMLAGLITCRQAIAATCKTSVSVVTNEKGRIVSRIKTRTCYPRR